MDSLGTFVAARRSSTARRSKQRVRVPSPSRAPQASLSTSIGESSCAFAQRCPFQCIQSIATLVDQGGEDFDACKAADAAKGAELADDAIIRLDPVVDLLVVIDSEIGRTVFSAISRRKQYVIGCRPVQLGDVSVF